MLVWVIAAIVCVLDQCSKSLIVSSLAPEQSIAIVPGALWLTYVQNRHGAFGLFGASRVILIALAFGVLAAFALSLRDGMKHSRTIRLAFGLILGGAIGNIADRLHYAWVVDFIDFKTIWPNVFNVADSAVCIGVFLLVVHASFAKRRRANPREVAPS